MCIICSLALVEKSLKSEAGFNFYRHIRLSTISAIFTGGFLRKPSVHIIFILTVR
jgi:hypothetical protein